MFQYNYARYTRGGQPRSCNTVTANQIEAFQTADQRAEMMSQPIQFFHVFIWIGGSNPAHAGLKPLFHLALFFIKQNCKYNNTLQLQSIWNVVLHFFILKGKVLWIDY